MQNSKNYLTMKRKPPGKKDLKVEQREEDHQVGQKCLLTGDGARRYHLSHLQDLWVESIHSSSLENISRIDRKLITMIKLKLLGTTCIRYS